MPFQSGQSGNPGGRVREKPFRDALKIELAAAGEDQKALREIAANLIINARKPASDTHNPIPAIKEIADRLDGKAHQSTELSGDPENPVTIEAIAREIIRPPKDSDA